ncbi:MAG: oligosaccharide flippase family protein, partial [Candidatus Lokiarchaeota archaeon]|nr:oligosaccharide flippase family protein [Candidatus Lokiarchaeota archaeon]
PRLFFALEKVKELFGFGKWILGSSILFFLITQGDDIFVGKLLGTTALGFYQMAYRISNMPATEITHVISQVTFPAYSKLQENIPKLREAYLKVLQLTAFLSFPIAGLIFILAPDFTRIFLGEKWIPMVPAMQVLTLYGAIRSIGATTGPLFQGAGRPSILAKLAVIQLLMMIVIIYPLTNKFGILGTAITIVVPNLIMQIIAGIKVCNIIKCGGYKFVKPLLFPLISISIVILSLYIFINIQKNIDITIFVILLILSGATYLGMSHLFKKIFGYDTVEMLVKFLKQKGNN